MSPTYPLSYLVFLSSPFDTPEKIQEIAHLPSPPEIRPVEKADDEDDEENNSSSSSEEYDKTPTSLPSPSRTRTRIPTECCIISHSTKTLLLAWSRETNTPLRHPIISIVTVPSTNSHPASTPSPLFSLEGTALEYPTPFFFYGTLSCPGFLREKLGVEELPRVRAGRIRGGSGVGGRGFRMMFWGGKYRALIRLPCRGAEIREEGGNHDGYGEEYRVRGSGDECVDGVVYMVESEEQFQKLAAWEGGSYCVERCQIELLPKTVATVAGLGFEGREGDDDEEWDVSLDVDGDVGTGAVDGDGGKRLIEGRVFVYCGDARALTDGPRSI